MKFELQRRKIQGLSRLAMRLTAGSIKSKPLLPYKLEVMISGRCNSHCKTCGIWRRQISQSQELTLSRINRIYQSFGSHVFWAGISGGEPTLRDDFVQIAESIYENCPNLVLLNFGTNGLKSDDIINKAMSVASLKIPFIMCSLSIDGIGLLHDDIRGTKGAFESLLKTAKGLIEVEKKYPNFNLSFQTTIGTLNMHNINEISSFLKSNFPGHAHISTIATDSFIVGRGSDLDSMGCITDIATIKKLGADIPSSSLLDILPRSYLGHLPAFLDGGKSPLKCVAGRDMLIVDPVGIVQACDYLDRPLGNLADYDFNLESLYKSNQASQIINQCKHCKKCFTPCQVYPSLLGSPLQTIKGYFFSFIK